MTLIEDLETAIKDYEKIAESNVWMTTKWGPKESHERAERLRKHVDRLQALLDHNKKVAAQSNGINLIVNLLNFINDGETGPNDNG